MKSITNTGILLLVWIFLAQSCNPAGKPSIHKDTLWYAQPASNWMEALPVGNGRLGAMVFGNPLHERIQLNEDSMWPGGPDFGDSKGSAEDLDYIRDLILKGKIHEADQQIVERFSYKWIKRSHQTLGDLYLEFERDSSRIENYRRSLSLDKATTSVNYQMDGYNFSHEVFSSVPDDVLIIHLQTNHPQGMNMVVTMDRPDDQGNPTVKISNPSDHEIEMSGTVTQNGGFKFSEPFPIDYGVKFQARLKIRSHEGIITAQNGSLRLENVKDATIFLVANTSFYHEDFIRTNELTLKALDDKSMGDIRETHISDFQNLYNRLHFDLDGAEIDSLPTDVRLNLVKEGNKDLDLQALLYQYGRYLLISSSRPGTNPANLQGIWNEHIEAPWNADYHVNINIQMNYWPSEVTNLSECHLPLFDFIDKVIERGRRTASEQYGINRGAVIHHTTDLWAPAYMRAAQPYWGSWIHGGGWIVQHYWEHYRFTEDLAFLEKRAYPAMKAIAEFYLDWLVKDVNTGQWISFPETSPENSYLDEDGQPAAVAYGAAMGHQIIGEVFDNVIDAAAILKIEDSFVDEVKGKRKNLTPGVIVGEDGRILEWTKPFEEPEKGHRHMSHLYALHPGDDITPENAEAFEAAKKTIAYRLQHGGAKTGWSRAWMINFNARLLDGIEAEENINKFLELSTASNLFDMHPPFQIDGNFGYTAGLTELLLQSHQGFLRLLPALPPSWKNGKITGLKARGNIQVAIEWKESVLTKVTLNSPVEKTIKIVYNNQEKEVLLKRNKPVQLNSLLSKTG